MCCQNAVQQQIALCSLTENQAAPMQTAFLAKSGFHAVSACHFERASTMQTHWTSRTRELRSPSILSHVCIQTPSVVTCRSQGQSLPQSEPPVSSLGGIQTRPARWQWSAGSSQALWCWVTAASSSRSCTMAQRWLRLILRLQLAAARARIGR